MFKLKFFRDIFENTSYHCSVILNIDLTTTNHANMNSSCKWTVGLCLEFVCFCVFSLCYCDLILFVGTTIPVQLTAWEWRIEWDVKPVYYYYYHHHHHYIGLYLTQLTLLIHSLVNHWSLLEHVKSECIQESKAYKLQVQLIVRSIW